MDCPQCHRPFEPIRHQKFCSEKCRLKAWHRKQSGNEVETIIKTRLEEAEKRWKKATIEAVMKALDPILSNLKHRLEDLEAFEIEVQRIEGQEDDPKD